MKAKEIKAPEDIRRVSFDLDREIHKRLKRLAVDRETAIHDLVRSWVTAGVARAEGGKAAA
jgi:hypothetical protein